VYFLFHFCLSPHNAERQKKKVKKDFFNANIFSKFILNI